MKKINVTLEGYAKGSTIYASSKELLTQIGGRHLKASEIASYTLIDESNQDQYSFWKGALGVVLLGGFGAIAGLKGKKKTEYLIAVEWKDGEKSLILLDDKLYKIFVRTMF